MSRRRTRQTLRPGGGCVLCWLCLMGCGETEESNDEGTGTSPTTSTRAVSNNTTVGATNSAGPSTSTGSATATTASGGGGRGGAASMTGTDGTGVGGSAGAVGFMGSGGATGSGGTAGTAGGGAGGGPNHCSDDYTGPIGGPREDGPEVVAHACDQVTDEQVLARYKDFDAKVPLGLYWEPSGTLSWWGETCSEGPADTLDRANENPIGEIEDQLSSDWSYEVSGCYEGSRRLYSDLRCDYFDGTTLAGNSSGDLAYLASLLWWMDNGNLTGAQILGYTSMFGGATDWIVVCTIRTSFGDFGLCDQITLQQTMHSVTVAGVVTLGEPTTVRTIEGDCN